MMKKHPTWTTADAMAIVNRYGAAHYPNVSFLELMEILDYFHSADPELRAILMTPDLERAFSIVIGELSTCFLTGQS